VWTWGYGGSFFGGGGQLGHNSTDSVEKPKLVEAFKNYGVKAKSVSVGSKHTLILTVDGEVLSCGVGEYGRLGTGTNDDAWTPQPLETLVDDDIIQIAAGGNHSLALTAEGKIYSWGRNDTGALGHGDSYIDIYSMEDYPRAVECEDVYKKGKVVQIAAGKGRSAALTSDGRLFLWGRNLGHVPTIVEGSALNGLKVAKVSLGGEAGKSVIAVICEDQSLWTFGDGSSKLIGQAVSGRQPTPMRVPAFSGRKVLDVFTGPGQHMAALVET
jgi:alpha-tubulin suppressor-like RCC1 family protein